MDTTETPTSGAPDDDGQAKADPQAQAENLDALRTLLAGAQNTDLAEPDDDDPEGDRVDWVRTGMVRLWIGGKRYRLRRPFLGELRDLDLALENALEDINDRNMDARIKADDLGERADKIDADKRMTAKTRAAKVRELRAEDKAIAREVTQYREDTLIAWWTQVFDKLLVETTPPPDLPAWLANMALPQRALQHWRSVPLGRGGTTTGTTPPR